MGYFDTLVAAGRSPYPPDHDFWYTSLGDQSATGVRVSADTALNVGAVFACATLLADMIATPPLVTYERQGDNARTRATSLRIYQILHDAPNDEFTSQEFRAYGEMCRLQRGNAYARKVPGPSGFVDQLYLLHPDLVTPRRLPGPGQGIPGPVVYDVRDPDGRPYTLQADEVMHLRGPLSRDGITGMSVVSLARESIGLALATESYGARFFSQNSVPRGVITVEGKLEREGRARLRESWSETYAGLANAGKVAVLDAGASFNAIGMSNEDSQYLSTRSFQVNEIARWFRIPPHMIGDLEKSTSWGTGIEQMSLGFVIYTMLPRYTNWEAVIQRDLILNTARFYAEFNVDVLLRGDAMARAQALQIQRQNGIITRSEWRVLENRNPIDDDGGADDFWMPANMMVVGAPAAAPIPAATPAALLEKGDTSARSRQLASLFAGQKVRKEVKALSRQAARSASDPSGWRSFVTEFYDGFTRELAADLMIPEGQARLYCETHRDRLLQDGAGVMHAWEETATPVLAALALEES